MDRANRIMNDYLNTGKIDHSDLSYLLKYAASNRVLEHKLEQQKQQYKSNSRMYVKAIKQRTTEVNLLRQGANLQKKKIAGLTLGLDAIGMIACSEILTGSKDKNLISIGGIVKHTLEES